MKTKKRKSVPLVAPDIRRDLYAVKTWDNAVYAWLIVLVTRDVSQARNRLALEALSKHTVTSPKITHPTKNEVDLWVCANGPIDRQEVHRV